MFEPKRLFLAIELSGEIREQLIHWRTVQFPPETGRPVASDNLHLALTFLGDVSDEKQQALLQLVGRTRQSGLTSGFDDAGQWSRSRVVWLGMCQLPRGLLQLANMLWTQAARSGCYQSPQSFHPHIMLLRDVGHAVPIPSPDFGWSFPATEFALYFSSFVRGCTRHTQLQRWMLTR